MHENQKGTIHKIHNHLVNPFFLRNEQSGVQCVVSLIGQPGPIRTLILNETLIKPLSVSLLSLPGIVRGVQYEQGERHGEMEKWRNIK